MKTTLAILATLITFQATMSYADIANPEPQLRLRRLNLGFKGGTTQGQGYFRVLFARGCSFLTVENGMVLDALKETSDYNPGPNDDWYMTGYKSGWLFGFIDAYQKAYTPCTSKMTEVQRQALAYRVGVCQKEIDLAIGDNLQIQDVVGHLEYGNIPLETRKRIISFVTWRDEESAWQALSEVVERHTRSLPCQVVLTQAIYDYIALKENLNAE
ncbi:MAG: hypothetical protein EOP09_07080 [Proteobacteria bacterium]|nr:MAG: hypothetical protein EOP09_07080 [Pseudomonadota bacterium]